MRLFAHSDGEGLRSEGLRRRFCRQAVTWREGQGLRRINAYRQLPVLRMALEAHQDNHAGNTDIDRPAKAA